MDPATLNAYLKTLIEFAKSKGWNDLEVSRASGTLESLQTQGKLKLSVIEK